MHAKPQPQRFERKYFITERQAREIQGILAGHMVPDRFSEVRPDHMYPVHSLYVDSVDLSTYWATVHCEKKRFKLRVRFYDDAAGSPLFFEIKRRENECILKQRGVVKRDSGALLLAGHVPGTGHLVSATPESLGAVQRFCFLMQRLRAQPTVAVSYLREAWVSPDGRSVRVTIDRGVRGEVRREPIFDSRMRRPVAPFGARSILEVKFTERYPDWFRHMVEHFGLIQTAVPKYCGSVASAEEYESTVRGRNGGGRGASEGADWGWGESGLAPAEVPWGGGAYV